MGRNNKEEVRPTGLDLKHLPLPVFLSCGSLTTERENLYFIFLKSVFWLLQGWDNKSQFAELPPGINLSCNSKAPSISSVTWRCLMQTSPNSLSWTYSHIFRRAPGTCCWGSRLAMLSFHKFIIIISKGHNIRAATYLLAIFLGEKRGEKVVFFSHVNITTCLSLSYVTTELSVLKTVCAKNWTH